MRALGFISLVAASGHRRTKPEEVRGPKPPYTGDVCGVVIWRERALRIMYK